MSASIPGEAGAEEIGEKLSHPNGNFQVLAVRLTDKDLRKPVQQFAKLWCNMHARLPLCSLIGEKIEFGGSEMIDKKTSV